MAATFTPIGINFSAINNLDAPDFGFANKTTAEFIDYIPEQANAATGDLYGIVVMIVLLVFLIWMLTDISQYGLFRYNTVRALGIALGITITIGVIMLSINYMTNFIHVSILTALYILILVYVIIANPA